MVGGSGHQSYFHSVMRGRRAEQYHVIRDSARSATAFPSPSASRPRGRNGKVVLFEGDGSLLMHIQELETMRRHGIKLLICVMNDGAYGAESTSCAMTASTTAARSSAAPISPRSPGFGLRGATVTDLARSSRCSRPMRPRTRPRSGTSTSPTRRESDHEPPGAPRPRQDVGSGCSASPSKACSVLSARCLALPRASTFHGCSAAGTARTTQPDTKPTSYASRQDIAAPNASSARSKGGSPDGD